MGRAAKRVFIAILCGISAVGLHAAPPQVSVSMQPDSILIGDHVTLRIEVRKDMMQVVDFPVRDSKDALTEALFFFGDTPVDTVEVRGREQILVKEYGLTSFHGGQYTVDSLPVLYIDKNITDTLYTSTPLKLTVTSIPIDTTRNTIFDIKKPEQAPLLVEEVKGYFITILLLACVLVAVVYLIANHMSRRRKRAPGARPKPRIPPHIRAIGQLERLHNQKLWQNSRHKEYYSLLTDIVREYIEGRYGVGAMEMTSDEIVSAMAEIDLPEKDRAALLRMLRTADLVKFAKHVPDADYNETAYLDAYYFVEDTKEEAEQVREPEAEAVQPEAAVDNPKDEPSDE